MTRHSRESPIHHVLRWLIAAYLIEAGLVLTVWPWTAFLERNYFALAWPMLGQIMESAYFRGAVTGVGLVTMAAGVRDLAAAIVGRRAAADETPTLTPPRS